MSDGTPKAILDYRAMVLQAVGFETGQAEKLAPTMQGRLRTEVSVEAMKLARDAGVYSPPEPAAEDDSDDPAELARRHGRRYRL